MYAKLLKIPTFTTYKEALRQLSPDSDVGEILLSLMKTEYEQRQENQNLCCLKRAGFPFTKTLKELDLTRYSGSINEIFMNERLSRIAEISQCWGIQAGAKHIWRLVWG